MTQPRVCVLRAPGTNCDVETAHAFTLSGADARRLHLFRLLERPEQLLDYQILCIPGGFSYGDDIGAGVIFASQLRGALDDVVRQFLTEDRLAMGICNGFQVLLKSGVFEDSICQPVTSGIRETPGDNVSPSPGDECGQAACGGSAGARSIGRHRDATLTWNDSGRFTCRWVRLKVASTSNVFLRGIDEIELPVAHAEGRVAVRSPEVITQWSRSGRIALRYTSSCGTGGHDELREPPGWPDNPNGSVDNIAGLSDATGRILGLMPHPERFIHATQHPQWTRRKRLGDGDGLRLFQNAIEYFA